MGEFTNADREWDQAYKVDLNSLAAYLYRLEQRIKVLEKANEKDA